MRAALEGLQTGAAQYAFVKSMPFAASRSMFGVFTSGWPPRQPIQSFRSSTAMKRTFGLLFVAPGRTAEVATAERKSRREKARMPRHYHAPQHGKANRNILPGYKTIRFPRLCL